MFYKYGLNSGSLLRIVPDIIEYFRESNPMMKQLFDRYMPFESTGKTAQEMFHQLLGSIQGHDRIAFNNAPRLVWKAMNTPNRVSSKVIFGYADPAIKYARFKQYVNAGVSPQEAANQVHMDLIRYGMRSDAVDIWKGLAMNLFVPWRVGTVQSLYKSMRHTPVQAVLWIGAIDALREEVYRKTGWWWHLPIDYVEGPLYKLLSNHDAGTTASLAASTAAFGPGGEYTTRFWGDVFKAISSNKIDGKVLLAPLWSVATFVDPYGALFEARSYMHDGNTAHLVKLASMFALGAHDAVNYRPARLGAFIPNDVMSKAPRVLTAEAIQDRNKKIQELQQQRPPRPTIRQRVGP
jgi:hypothetical protein